MNLIIRKATVIDPQSPFHNQTVDIQIKEGKISKIATEIDSVDAEELVLENLHISQGWFDSSVSFGEPGFEERETIANGLHVAGKSGFTGVALQPNSNPVIDNQSQISFILSKSKDAATAVFPIGALTKNSDGKDLAELFDMKNAGAVAFGDYGKSLENPNLLKIALQYAQDFDALPIVFNQDSNLKGNGVAHEGIVSTRLGLKGIPALAEELHVARNLYILEYTGGKMHFPTISTSGSVALIREAKAKGLNITCSVSVHHMTMTDEKLEGFDTRYKVSPPLRDESHREALIEGALDGTIDMVTSDHNPIDIEHKKMEFDLAKNGTIGLESAFGTLMTVLPLETAIDKLTAARKIFSKENESVKEGILPNITLFNPDVKGTFTKENILSKSKNSAFLGMPMTGKVYGIINNGKLVI
ncbi:dihydroorotase [Flavobacterium pallidum]|uniref:Dihydroorotase n=1 Tax=Flavobacterium pallidum TaxID=2172098 RepID=A0A2S1SJ57_9FLAO|nr:dihydroorotase [Flavobacterium pallidum]AWI26387.1 dihydroorotase [Flavobacterium pallidum]